MQKPGQNCIIVMGSARKDCELRGILTYRIIGGFVCLVAGYASCLPTGTAFWIETKKSETLIVILLKELLKPNNRFQDIILVNRIIDSK